MVNVTSRWQATEFLSHIPLRLRLALLLVRFAQPAKVRLRASHSAQNDRLVVCFAICVCFGVVRDAREVVPYNKTLAILPKLCYNNSRKAIRTPKQRFWLVVEKGNCLCRI